MQTATSTLVDQLLLQAFLLFLLLGSVAGILVGAGLLARSDATLGLLRKLNQWVSTRRPLKPAESARDFDSAVKSHRIVYGALFAAAGAYCLFILLTRIDPNRLAQVFAGQSAHAGFLAILFDAARWLLALGSALAIALGIMLITFPAALHALESRANRWVSSRRMVSRGDVMYQPLDRLVEVHPRSAGWIILVASVLAGAGPLIFLLARR
jgi:hypothetical protein